ncbi:MAG: 16S rRNA (uracil(1498)-N(3))-methyltransferase [Actinobacteria bacterium]|nr:16S rRNA (uracil(1498)-N(3))-methyltransferase [Actinomycetota bacterium]MDA2981680.1 16S rRNA (uracil(1498)-N(3))-methyltransferase [Actinomycetota bacterium]MDA2996347.1 16S rRNA (uracil(1498)-N(3))-methyltransferase [Actinomycetota bacterium]
MLTLFLVDKLEDSNLIEVVGDEAHHAIKVLRINVGEEILVSDGAGNWVRASIENIEKKTFTARVLERGFQPEKSPRLIVVQGLPKSDRVKDAIEILVESGVDLIIPWQADRSISKWRQDSLDKWQSAAVAATKQSRRFRKPEIIDGLSLSQLLEIESENSVFLVMHESATTKLSEVVTSKFAGMSEIIIVIGPEGGISESELAVLEGAGAHIVGLGPEVFRSAHAGGAALSAVSALIGRW